jgi:hypothetical protein
MTIIQISYFDRDHQESLVNGYHGTPALDQLLTENSINPATTLTETEGPEPLNADSLITQLSALKNKFVPKDTIQKGTLTTTAEEDLSPEDLEALKEQETVMFTQNDQTMIQHGNITKVSPKDAPPVGYPDLVEFLSSLETARNEGLYAQVSYIPE